MNISSSTERLGELIRGIESAMLVTVNTDGSLNSRPMVVPDFDFDGDLWFFAQSESHKVDAISADSHVCVNFMDPGTNRYISVSGVAEVVGDPWVIDKLWAESFEKWFPRGPKDEDLVLLQVHVSHAEYWDAPHSELVESFSFGPSPAARRDAVSDRLSGERHFHS